PLCVAGHQIRIHFFHFFGHEAELRDAVWIKLVLVAEGHRFQRKDCFARLVHRLDLVLETSGGDGRAELTVGPNDYSYSPRHSYPRDAGDKCFRLCSARADADGSGLTCHSRVADFDVITAGGKIRPSSHT